jgi:hypothetical protein
VPLVAQSHTRGFDLSEDLPEAPRSGQAPITEVPFPAAWHVRSRYRRLCLPSKVSP